MVRLVQKLGFNACYQTQNSPCGLRALTIIVFVTEFHRDKIRGAFHCPIWRLPLSRKSAPNVTAVDHVSMQLGRIRRPPYC